MSGPFIQKKPYPGTELFRWGVNGEKDARNKIKILANAGVDLIKLIDQDNTSPVVIYSSFVPIFKALNIKEIQFKM